MMRLEIVYESSFDYAERVRDSYNRLRARPAAVDRQRVVSYQLVVEPSAKVFTYRDAWGTSVDAFGIRRPHDHLRVLAQSVVETFPAPQPDGTDGSMSYADPSLLDEHFEFLQSSQHVSWGNAIAEAARDTVAGLDEPVEQVAAIHHAVGGTLSYAPGSTYVGVPLVQVFEQRRGVCQDFAHLALAMCRCLGIPARYVSGYLFAASDSTGEEPADADGVEVRTHAWIEVLVPGFGWWSLDPTNRRVTGERHVKIGHGRDYEDVAPLRGVYKGDSDHELSVVVTINRTGPGRREHPRTQPERRRYFEEQQQQQLQQQQ